ncbi:MAG: G1 family glutamic endopeptidase [Candidatus Levyibacteriota bacterium]
MGRHWRHKNKCLIQAGTQNVIDPAGNVTTTAFYEMLPNVSQTIPVHVKTGDTI